MIVSGYRIHTLFQQMVEGVRQILPVTIHRNEQIDDDFQLYLLRFR